MFSLVLIAALLLTAAGSYFYHRTSKPRHRLLSEAEVRRLEIECGIIPKPLTARDIYGRAYLGMRSPYPKDNQDSEQRNEQLLDEFDLD